MKIALVLGAVGIAAVVGCGGDGGGSCGKVAPCGGEIGGAWRFVDSCTNATMTSALCPTATSQISGQKLGGGVLYNADLTYDVMLLQSATVKSTLPASCLAVLVTTCAQLSANFSTLMAADPANGIKSASCVSTGGDCVCTIVYVNQTITESGTYSTAGTILTHVRDDRPGVPSQTPYCVQGNELHIVQTTSMSMGMMGPMTITGDVVLRK